MAWGIFQTLWCTLAGSWIGEIVQRVDAEIRSALEVFSAGDVVHRVDVRIRNRSTISILLMRKNDELYVLMDASVPGEQEFYKMNIGQFQALTEAMLATQSVIDNLKTGCISV